MKEISSHHIRSPLRNDKFVLSDTTGYVLLTVPNRSPLHGSYQFSRITDQLSEPGTYILQFQLSPALPGRASISLVTQIVVSPGDPAAFDIKVNTFSQ